MGILDRLSRRLGELSEELLPGDLRESVESARDLLERNQPAAAAAALESALAQKPDHASALYLLGVARQRLGEWQRALDAFTRAHDARAGFVEAAIGMGDARLALGDATGAIPAFREAVAAGGSKAALADAYRGLGRAYLATGAADKGLRELRKALTEDPDDLDAAVALAEALVATSDDADEARAPLERLIIGMEPPPAALAALGMVHLGAGRRRGRREGHGPRARHAGAGQPRPRQWRPCADGPGWRRPRPRLAALADALAARGDTRGAHEQILRALALAPRDPGLSLRLARLHAAADNPEAALDAYSWSAQLGAEAKILDEALALAINAGLDARAIPLGEKILAANPGHVLARAVTFVAAGNPTGALAALAGDPSLTATLLRARLALADEPVRAAELAFTILRQDPGNRAARRLLMDAGPRVHGVPSVSAKGDRAAPDLVELAARIQTALRADSVAGLTELAVEVSRALEAYDRPLLLTVMGEFSSGKSTFVNAFLGAQVAPVGITPTTATINVLTYGREPGARIVYRDERVRELPGAEAGAVLAHLDAAEARLIRRVDVLHPLDDLLRVNIVDTPGLNSILPEHEATAREFIAQADAVIWLFSAGQAGKASEREALEKIRAEGKRVLGVVNKIDQASAADVAPLLAHLKRELGDLVEDLIPVSARRALAARAENDLAALAESAWPRLAAALEERFFHKARELKRAALAQRLTAVLARAKARTEPALAGAHERLSRWQNAANAARADIAIFTRAVVPEERRALAERIAQAYRAAARDVLELVRPRRTPFGENSATRADRNYLLGFLERSLAAAIEPTRARVVAELRRAAGDAASVAGDPEISRRIAAGADDAIALVEARVFDRARAFLRGHLRGGGLDDFFARTLAKLALDEDTVFHALYSDAPELEGELARPLAAEGTEALRGIAARLQALADGADVDAFAVENLLEALAAHEAELRNVSPR